MLLIFSGVFIMAIAGDEADIKASYFSTFSYSFLALIRIVPIISVDHLVAPGKETTQNLVHKQISQLYRAPPENPQSFSDSAISHPVI